MVEKARKILESYDLFSVKNLGIKRSNEHFGSSHTVVTYFPLNTLGKVSQNEVLFSLNGDNPVNLYVHIPFCKSKCGYCSYVSEPSAPESRINKYLSSLSRELRMYGDSLQGRKVSSVYFGGGTPTILNNQQLNNLFESIYREFNVEEDANICVEANPVTLKEKLNTLIQNEVGRLSIGVQSFNNELLRRIGRGYIDNEDIISVIKEAKESGIKVLNIDMMQNLPSQTLHDVEFDLETIAELKPDSVTWYTMRVAPDCRLYDKFEFCEEDSLLARIMITEELKEMGYIQTSGDRFCLDKTFRDGFKEIRSDINSDMLGVGVSAYSHLNNLIFRNEVDVDRYMEIVLEGKLPVVSGKSFTNEEEIVVQFVLGLKNGLELNDIAKTLLVGSIWSCFPSWNGVGQEGKLFDFFKNYTGYRKKIPELVDTGILEFDGNRLQFTEKGRLFENEVCRMLYSPVVDAQTKGKRVRALLKKLSWDIHTTPMGCRVRA